MRHPTARRIAVAAAALAATLAGALPVPAQAANVGTGVVSGGVWFAGAGVPVATASCAATSFTLSGRATGTVLNTVLTGHVGDVFLSGSGSSLCENATTAAGNSLSISASGVGPTLSRVGCSLTGVFVRIGPAVLVDVSGYCTVNTYPAGRVRFLAEVAFAPTTGDGVTTRIRAATFAGHFTVIPA